MFWVFVCIILFVLGLYWVYYNVITSDAIVVGIMILSFLTLLFGIDSTPEDRTCKILSSTEYTIVSSPEELNFNKAYYNDLIGLFVERSEITNFETKVTEEQPYVLKEVKKYDKTFFKFGFDRTEYTYFYNE